MNQINLDLEESITISVLQRLLQKSELCNFNIELITHEELINQHKEMLDLIFLFKTSLEKLSQVRNILEIYHNSLPSLHGKGENNDTTETSTN